MNTSTSNSDSNGSDSNSPEISDDSDDSVAVVEGVFQKYSHNGKMSRAQFSLVILKLREHVDELSREDADLNIENLDALFDLFAGKHSMMDLLSFKQWWMSNDKFAYFTGEKSRLLKKAYRIYKKYSTLNKSKEKFGTRQMKLGDFSKLLEDLKIRNFDDDDFDNIDLNGDGVLSFKEFCKWLHWF